LNRKSNDSQKEELGGWEPEINKGKKLAGEHPLHKRGREIYNFMR